MGTPEQSKSSTLPSRARFTWDWKTPSWTDGKGDKEQHPQAVLGWCMFQDTLDGTTLKKGKENFRRLGLESQLHGRGKYLVRNLTAEQLKSKNASDHIVAVVYTRDPLNVVIEGFRD